MSSLEENALVAARRYRADVMSELSALLPAPRAVAPGALSRLAPPSPDARERARMLLRELVGLDDHIRRLQSDLGEDAAAGCFEPACVACGGRIASDEPFMSARGGVRHMPGGCS